MFTTWFTPLTCDQALLLPFLCWRPSADFLTWNHPPTHQKQTNKQKPDRRLFTRTNEPMIKFLGSCHTLTGTWPIARIIRNIVGHLCSSYIVKLSDEVCVIGIIEMLVSYMWYSCCFVLLDNNIIKMFKNCVFVRGLLTNDLAFCMTWNTSYFNWQMSNVLDKKHL